MFDKYCILGTDNRSFKIKEMYESQGKKMVDYENAEIIIAPVPFSRDDITINGTNIECLQVINSLSNKEAILFSGVISNNMKNILMQNNVKYYDLYELEEVAILNAIPTAEGAIATAMEMTDFTLHGSKVLILGYGRIGKILSKMLLGIGSNVYCSARKEKDFAMIKAMGYNSINTDEIDDILGTFDVIFNTIPSMILDENRLKRLKKGCSIIDLASAPGGVDFEKSKELGINAVLALSLPSKVAPTSAAIYLKETIDGIIKKCNL